ncbi:MAG: hypothetical protein ACRDAM_04005, partial [Casimicrobium sp.]
MLIAVLHVTSVHAQECTQSASLTSNTAHLSQVDALSTKHSIDTNTTTAYPAQTAHSCDISAQQWDALSSRAKVVWDIRGSRNFSGALIGSLPISINAAKALPTQLNQAILFVDDGLDTAATDALCKTLRQDNAQVFVLKGGARAWQAHTQKLSEAQRIQGAELSLIDAARWFDDTNTEMVTVDNT